VAGRAHALVVASDDAALRAEFDLASKAVHGPTRADALKTLTFVLYQALAAAEPKAPPSAQGAFIPAGDRFDAFAAITKVLQSATGDLHIVDPYMDETALTDFGGAVPTGVQLRLLAVHRRPTLTPALGPSDPQTYGVLRTRPRIRRPLSRLWRRASGRHENSGQLETQSSRRGRIQNEPPTSSQKQALTRAPRARDVKPSAHLARLIVYSSRACRGPGRVRDTRRTVYRGRSDEPQRSCALGTSTVPL
jgi:hypothetical protein